ncbi:S8 family serine peptidase [Motilibacter aurantiacus]|uniref:S8 family serine peptidase n=1 Tax=Motilibacter aurantiacus TaxID=2714955 RepID=UPI00140D5221|nr:S8 family serine peptidase [Motilibacter aurantiacus]NHC45045.1 S8 family serine peptidase [Motilibacter aurantiacus]
MPRSRPIALAAASTAVGLLAAALAAPAATATPRSAGTAPSVAADATGDSVFVWYDADATAVDRAVARASVAAGAGAASTGRGLTSEVVEVPEGRSASEVAAALRAQPGVRFAVPDLAVRRDAAPDYLGTGRLWGLRNDGQRAPGVEGRGSVAGTFNVDVDAPEAWSVTQGARSTVVAVIDTGIDINHPDLAQSIWVNPRPATSGAYAGDVNGWDFCHDDASVYDSDEYYESGNGRELNDLHGTHVAGTIAAANDNAGAVGVAPGVTVMPLKAIGTKVNGDACGSNEILEALMYAARHGAKVVNASWEIEATSTRDRAELDSIMTALGREYGMVIVAAAGNGVVDEDGNLEQVDIDAALRAQAAGDRDVPVPYPAASRAGNVVTVAAVNNQGRLAGFSNYGRRSVDIGAPGVAVWSTAPGVLSGGNYDQAYLYEDGTSMAAPHVSGEAALVLSQGNLPAATVVQRILAARKPVAGLTGRVATGGMASAYRALQPWSALLTSGPGTLRAGRTAVVTARLLDGVSWSPRAARRVTPCSRPVGTTRWACGTTVVTDARGVAQLRTTLRVTTEFQWRFTGATGAPSARSAVLRVRVTR